MPTCWRSFSLASQIFQRASGDAEIVRGLLRVQERTSLARCRCTGIVVVFVGIHRFTASNCGDLYVLKHTSGRRAKIAIREIRHARDRSLYG